VAGTITPLIDSQPGHNRPPSHMRAVPEGGASGVSASPEPRLAGVPYQSTPAAYASSRAVASSTIRNGITAQITSTPHEKPGHLLPRGFVRGVLAVLTTSAALSAAAL
jgi:hypothetical protein